MFPNAALYSQHHSMQAHHSRLLLSSIVSKMDWRSDKGEVVMDIGCGPGDSTCHLMLPFFPDVKKIIAVDVLPEMIKFAREQNAHPKIEYHVANIEEEFTLQSWKQGISKTISVYCLHWAKNQRRAFQNIFHLLKPGGEAAVLFALSTPFWNSYELHVTDKKWSKFLKDVDHHIPDSHYGKYGADYYNRMLKDIGFIVHICEKEEKTFAYANDDICKESCASISALTAHIPDEMKDEFKEALFQGFLKYSGRNHNAQPVHYNTTLTLHIQKPDT